MDDQEPPVWSVVKRGVRAVASSFPGAASLAQAWNEYESRQWQARVDELFEDMRKELDALKQRVGDVEERLKKTKDEFPALAETVVECVRREPSPERRRLFARAMVRLIVLELGVELSEKVALIRELDTLADMDLRVLHVFSDKRGHQLDKEEKRWREFGQTLREQRDALYGPLCKLESRGLVAGTTPPSGASYLGDDGIPQNWSWFARIMWAMPRGLCLIRILAEAPGQGGG